MGWRCLSLCFFHASSAGACVCEVLFCSVVVLIILYFSFLSMFLFQHVFREEGDVVSNASAGGSYSIPETPVRCLILLKRSCYYSASAIFLQEVLLSFRSELTPVSEELDPKLSNQPVILMFQLPQFLDQFSVNWSLIPKEDIFPACLIPRNSSSPLSLLVSHDCTESYVFEIYYTSQKVSITSIKLSQSITSLKS